MPTRVPIKQFISPARRRGGNWRQFTEVARAKIRVHEIVNRLNKCALGEVSMKDTEIKAGLGLLRKVVPDLTMQDLHIHKDPPLTVEELRPRLVAEVGEEGATLLLGRVIENEPDKVEPQD